MTTTHKDQRAVIEQPAQDVTIVERYALRPRWVTSRGLSAHKADAALTAGREALEQPQEVPQSPTTEDLREAFTLEHGGPNPYYRCNTCGQTEPGLRDYLTKHWQSHHQASEPVGINGLTEAETSASMSVRGLSAPIVGLQSTPDARPVGELTLAQITRIYDRYGGDMVNCTRAIERELAAARTQPERVPLPDSAHRRLPSCP